MLKSLFRKAAPRAWAPAGERIYAIGDVHGCYDAFERLLALIDADDRSREPARTRIIMLGDLVDRGPDTRRVVERAMQLTREREDVALIQGNHEEILLQSALGDRQMVAMFDRVGGRETLLSYGCDPETYALASLEELADLIAELVPPEQLAFLAAGVDHVVAGDYAFVHAGIRPGLALADQKISDLRWIREPFLSHGAAHEFVIVHGHTIVPTPEITANRIGIDTGAYASGTLTALGLEEDRRWFLTS